MKRNLKKIGALIMAFFLLAGMMPVDSGATFSVPTSTVRIGLYQKTTSSTIRSFISANLQNAADCGSGYEFGYYDAERNFVSVGGSTDTVEISVIIDKNMSYKASENAYEQSTEGETIVGCYHIKLSTKYEDYASAREAADTFTSVNAFVRYQDGAFYVLAGEYISADEASAAAASLEIQQEYTVDSGTGYTVAVVATKTDKILFEFDCGSKYALTLKPIAPEGVKAQTWYKGRKYYGDFQYKRVSGGNIYVANILNVDDYVKGVIPSEMSPSFPAEALKAQAVTARTYVMGNLNKHASYGFDICNTAECQVYYGRSVATEGTDAVVDATSGMYLTYEGKLCQTYYYSSNGGASESSVNVWTANLPYLTGVIDPYEADIAKRVSDYYWKETYTGTELANKLKAEGYNCSKIVKFEITKFTPTGNVLEIKFTDENGKTWTFSKRKTATLLGLRSQRYTVNGQRASGEYYVNGADSTLGNTLEGVYALGSGGTAQLGTGSMYAITGSGQIEEVQATAVNTSDKFVIEGSGWGHNVGMSQWGAYSMAKYHNKSYIDILTFYYTGAQVTSTIQ